MEIALIDETESLSSKQLQAVEELVQFAAEELKIESNGEVSITFVDNDRIQQVNREYRGKDTPTDVISFALEEDGDEELPIFFFEEDQLLPRNLGDILISVDRAKEQSITYAHSFERELGFLAVHGFLHLNGYDHMEPEDEEEMFQLQRKILNDYGLAR